MIAAVTGHRPNKLGGEYDLKGPITIRIREELFKWLDENKPDKIISGMALGVDQIWALCGVRRNIPMLAALPCKGQEKVWPEKSQYLYNYILRYTLVESKYISSEGYTESCMQERNKWMVDNCDVLVAVWDGSPGGTANCVEYARSIGKKIVRINYGNG